MDDFYCCRVLRQADIQGLHGAVSSSGAITTHGASSGAGGASGIGKAGAAALKEAEVSSSCCLGRGVLRRDRELGLSWELWVELVEAALA